MMPYYSRNGIVIYHADCRDVLPTLTAVSVNLILTDPPYNVSAPDIDLPGRKAMVRDFGKWDENYDPKRDLELWDRVLRQGSSVVAFTSCRLFGKWWEGLGTRLVPQGFDAWIKDNPPPHPRPVYVNAIEQIVWLCKAGAAHYWGGNGYTRNDIYAPSPSGRERTEHPTQKPLSVVRKLMLVHSGEGDLVLDPYMGSGTTLVAAKSLGRRAVGIEIEERYCEIAVARLRQEAWVTDEECYDPDADAKQGTLLDDAPARAPILMR